jgi:hypothetical protein
MGAASSDEKPTTKRYRDVVGIGKRKFPVAIVLD